jgi:5-methylcytosine-specific restriction endonuclease McrA
MAFSEAAKEQALADAGNRCECARRSHAHVGRCTTTLTKSTAEFHHKMAVVRGGSDSLSNCEALCNDCHGLIPTPS